MKNNPLIIGEGVNCIIANPAKWNEHFPYLVTENDETPPELKELGIHVKGCTITFPDEETKTIFCLRFL